MIKHMFRYFTLLGFLFGNTVIYAVDGLEIKPGLWEFTTQIKSEMLGSKTESEKECIKEPQLDPLEMLADMPKDACQSESKQIANGVSFTSTCKMNGAEQKANGTFTTDGTRVIGDMLMENKMGSMVMNVSMHMEGKRLSDCP